MSERFYFKDGYIWDANNKIFPISVDSEGRNVSKYFNIQWKNKLGYMKTLEKLTILLDDRDKQIEKLKTQLKGFNNETV